jgi:hypothetical protein
MKKLLVIFSLAMAAFAFQANAATFTLHNLTSGNIDVGINLAGDSLHLRGASPFSTTWTFTASKSVVDANVKITSNPAFKYGTDVFEGALNILHIATNNIDKTFIMSFLSGDTYSFVAAGTKSPATGSVDISVNSVPIPAAIWLFGSALAGLIAFSTRKSGSKALTA